MMRNNRKGRKRRDEACQSPNRGGGVKMTSFLVRNGRGLAWLLSTRIMEWEITLASLGRLREAFRNNSQSSLISVALTRIYATN